MTDKELLELAAKAAGMEEDQRYPGSYYSDLGTPWNPLTDDGDALRLAVKLNLSVQIGYHVSWSAIPDCDNWDAEDHINDPYAATRRVIVRAAAEIGKGMS